MVPPFNFKQEYAALKPKVNDAITGILKRGPWIGDLAYLAVLTGLVLFFFWQVWSPDPLDRARFQSGDFTTIFYPARYYVGRSIAEGRLPLWNPTVYGGYPHAADPQAATFYPLTWITIAATLGKLTLSALQWEAIGHFVLAALFTYLFIHYLLRNRQAAFLGALSFTFGGYLTGYPALQLSELEAAVWLPATLLAVTLAVDRRALRWAALGGITLGLVFLAGRPQSYLSILPLTLAWGTYRAAQQRLSWRSAGKLLATLLAFWLGTVVIQAFPTWELTRFSARSAITWANVTEGGFSWWELAGLALPVQVGSYALYSGLLALVLAGVALARRQGLFWFGAALASLFLAVGHRTALFSATYLAQRWLFPGYLRNFERLALVCSFSLALLAATGLQTLRAQPAHEVRTFLKRALALLGALLLLAAVWPWEASANGVPAMHRLLDALIPITLLLLGGWGTLTFLTGRWQAWALSLLLVVDLFTVNMGRILTPIADSPDPLAIVETLRPLQGYGGIFRVEGGEAELDFGNFLGLENVTGTAPLQPRWYTHIMEQVEELRRFQLMNVHLVVTRREIAHGAFKLLSEQEGLRIYAFFDLNPRAYLAAQTETAATDAAIVSLLNDPAVDLHTTTVIGPEIPELPQQPLAADEEVVIVKRTPLAIQVEVRAAVPRLLVYGDPAYPGWRARIDGVPTPIYSINGGFRGIIVPAGAHEITFVYRPILFYLGAALSSLTLGALLWLFRRRKKTAA